MKVKDSRLKSAPSMPIIRSVGNKERATKSLLINPDDLAEPLISIPPDGGWGWVVVAASFLAMFCLDGVGYCFAVFFQDISKDLNCEITDVALSSSMLGGFYYLAGLLRYPLSPLGPLTCSAINRFGFQKIAVAGGVLALLAFTAASYIKSVLPFTILVGFCGGSAFNLIYTPSVIAIGFYFERWRALAMAINCCGSSLGVMCFPIIMTYFLEKYTWRTKFRILSGIFGFCGFLGLAYKPIKARRLERTVQFGEISTAQSTTSMETEREIDAPGGLTGIFHRFRNALFPTISEVSVYSSHHGSRVLGRYSSRMSGLGYMIHRRTTTETEAMSYYVSADHENKSILYPVLEEESDEEEIGYFKRCCGKYCSRIRQCSACCRRNNSDASFTNVNRPMYRDDIFYTGSVNLVSQYSRVDEDHISRVISQRGEPSVYTLSVTRAPTQKDLMEQGQCKCCPEAFLRVLVTMLHFQMLKSPAFILLLISGYLSLMGTYITYTYIVEGAIEKGIEKGSATLLLSSLGIANTIGRAMCGVVSCLPTDINVISWISIGICGGITVASIYLTTTTGQIFFSCVFGFTIATFAVLRAIMFVELFGIENLTNCFGLNMVFQSAAAFSGVPIANYLYRTSNSFNLPFIFTGVAIMLSAIILIPVRCILRWEKRKMEK